MKPTLGMVHSLIKIELAYINTNHPDFWKTVPALTSLAHGFDAHHTKGTFTASTLKSSNSSTSNESMGSNQDDIALNPIASTPYSPKTQSPSTSPGLFSYLFKSSHSAPQRNFASPPPKPNQNASPTVQPAGGGDLVLTEKEEFETQLIMTLIHSYFTIVRKNLMDTIPKSIMHFLVNATLDALPSKLVTELYKEELFSDLLKEDESIRGQRARMRKELEGHRQALSLITPFLND